MTNAIDALMLEIARRYIPTIETLETRRSDTLDFHDVAVWSLREALAAAYAAGQAAAARDERAIQALQSGKRTTANAAWWGFAAEDSTAALQSAIDSGATTVFLPGSYRISTPVVIRGKVRRIIGTGGLISYGKDGHEGRDFILADGDSPKVLIEHFAAIHGGIEIDTRRTVIFRSVIIPNSAMSAKVP